MKNQIVINATGQQTRTALLENGELTQLFIESEENQRTVGNIYCCRVHKVMSGIKAAFIDMGTPKDAFLHFSDAGDNLEQYIRFLNGPDAIPKGASKSSKQIAKMNSYEKQMRVGDLLRTGQKVLVQIVKEPIGSKGPRVSTDITIAGRFLVLIPMGDYVAASKKISNYKERRRLKGIVGSMLPEGFGVIIRTVAQEQDKEAIEEDMRNVLKKWEKILARLEDAEPPALLHEDLDMTESLIRDLFAKHYERVLIDEPGLHKRVKEYVRNVAPQMLPNVELYKGSAHIFDYMKVAKDVDSVFSPRVSMPSGGYLIFEQTEAMYVVDVNSGPYAAKKRQEDNSLKTNLEAAREIAKQLRLRDIGGIICVDFIDLRSDTNRKKVYDELMKEFKKDQAKTNVLPMSEFGLVQITRQRIRPSVINSVSKVCPTCGGSGNVVSQNTVVADLDAWLSKFRHGTGFRAVEIYVNPYLKSYLNEGFFSIRRNWMAKYMIRIKVFEDDTVSLNEFKATLPGSDIDITDPVLAEDDLDEYLIEEGYEEENLEAEKENGSGSSSNGRERRQRRSNGDDNGQGSRRKKRNLKPRPKGKYYRNN